MWALSGQPVYFVRHSIVLLSVHNSFDYPQTWTNLSPHKKVHTKIYWVLSTGPPTAKILVSVKASIDSRESMIQVHTFAFNSLSVTYIVSFVYLSIFKTSSRHKSLHGDEIHRISPPHHNMKVARCNQTYCQKVRWFYPIYFQYFFYNVRLLVWAVEAVCDIWQHPVYNTFPLLLSVGRCVVNHLTVRLSQLCYSRVFLPPTSGFNWIWYGVDVRLSVGVGVGITESINVFYLRSFGTFFRCVSFPMKNKTLHIVFGLIKLYKL